MVKFETVKAGDTLYVTYVSGKGTQRRNGTRRVAVLFVDSESRTAVIRVDCMPVRTVPASAFARYSRNAPKK